MRLTGLTLRRYGPFEETTLAFDPAPGRINLVLAPNGAGKSVLRHAFGELLFGIGGQTPMGFRYGYGGMRLTATGVAPDGSPFTFTRHKGNRNTLTGPDDAPLDQAWMERLLGRADSRLLGQLFALDTERLRQGGRDLLSSGGALADALLAAAGGLREASALRRALEEERDRLAPSRRVATRPFYAALDRWSDSRKALRHSLIRPQEWAERERALSDAQEARDAANRAAAETGERVRRLERIRRTRPQLLRRANAAEWLATHPDAPRLSADLATRLPAAREATVLAAHKAAAAQEALARLDAEIASITTDDDLLARAEEVTTLGAAIGVVEQARQGLPDTEAELLRVRHRLAAGLAALGLPADADPVAQLPSPARLTELRRLIAEAAGQDAVEAGLPRRLTEAEARRAEAEAALEALPPAADAKRLDEVLAAARQDGDPVALLAAAGRTVAESEARLATAMAALPARLRDPGALATIDPPDDAKVDRLHRERDAAEAALARAEEVLGRAEADLSATRREQAALLAAGTPPTREALAKARARRDAGWALVFRSLLNTSDGAAEAAYAGGQPLALAYADAVRDADRLADARWDQAERATAAERLAQTLNRQESVKVEVAAARDGAAHRYGEARSAWDAAVHPLLLGPDADFVEVQRRLAAREAGLAASEILAKVRAAEAALRARQDGAAARLAEALGEAAPLTLVLQLDRAEARIRQHRAAEAERQTREAALSSARDAVRAFEAERAEAEARRGRWQRDWEAALARIGAAPGLPRPALEERLLACEALGKDGREAAALDARASTWRSSVQRFGEGYERLCTDLGFRPEPDPVVGVRALDRRQREEAARAARRGALQDGRAQALVLLRDEEAAHAGADAALRAVLAAIGAATPDEAETRIALGAERARQEDARTVAEGELLAGGDGLSLEALQAEAEAGPAEALEAVLAQAGEEQDRHAREAQDLVAAVTRLDLEMRQLAGDEAALRAAAAEAAASGEIGRTLEDAVLMQVAAGLLEAALGTVQEGADDRLLRRIGDAFSLLTNGAYTGVASHEDERGTARLTLRSLAHPDEDTGVDGLSEGTRDALFLALRLVAIEDQAASSTVLPFLGDDILQSFDDARATAAFRALLELSRTTQVILLSHHDHLLPVLRDAAGSEAIHVQRLPG